MDAPSKTGIVEATGIASVFGGKKRSKDIEAAMAGAIKAIEADSDAIWNDPTLTPEQKREQIAAINAPEAKRARMLAARDVVKEGYAEAARKKAATDELQRAREALAAAEKAATEAGVAS